MNALINQVDSWPKINAYIPQVMISKTSNVLQLKHVSLQVAACESLKTAHILGLRRFFLTPNENGNFKKNNGNFNFSGMWYEGNLDIYNKQFPLLARAFGPWFNSNTGYLSSKYFENYDDYTWQLKEKISASWALEKILEGPSRIECAIGVFVYFSYAVMRMIGRKKFDQLFGSIDGASPLIELLYVTTTTDNSIHCFFEDVSVSEGGSPDARPLEKGDLCYFEGVEYYEERHGYYGNGCGACVIYIGKNEKGEQLYIGFDFDTAVTEEQINQALIDLYLLPPKINVTEEILKKIPTLKDLKGFQPKDIKRFKYDLIQEIKTHELTPEFIQQLRERKLL